MGDHWINFDFAVHVPIDDFWHIGTPRSAAKGRTAPDPSGHELKWSGANLGACRGHANDDAFAPAFMS